MVKITKISSFISCKPFQNLKLKSILDFKLRTVVSMGLVIKGLVMLLLKRRNFWN